MKTTFDRLSQSVSNALNMSRESLTKHSNLGSLTEAAYNVTRHADDILIENEMYRLLMRVAMALEKVCLTLDDTSLPAAWDAEARRIVMWTSTECLNTVYRSVSFSSNPMSLLAEVAKVEAYKKVLHLVVGYPEALFDHEAMEDIFTGIERREVEAEEKRLTQVSKVIVNKLAKSKVYCFSTVNYKGQELKYTKLTSAGYSKRQVMDEARVWADSLRAEAGGGPYIYVEFN